MIADVTGGKYFNAQDTKTLRSVYAEIDKLEKTMSEGRLYTEYRELFSYALFPGLGLVLLEMFLACTRFRSLPKNRPRSQALPGALKWSSTSRDTNRQSLEGVCSQAEPAGEKS
jgi:hypothetical protein